MLEKVQNENKVKIKFLVGTMIDLGPLSKSWPRSSRLNSLWN